MAYFYGQGKQLLPDLLGALNTIGGSPAKGLGTTAAPGGLGTGMNTAGQPPRDISDPNVRTKVDRGSLQDPKKVAEQNCKTACITKYAAQPSRLVECIRGCTQQTQEDPTGATDCMSNCNAECDNTFKANPVQRLNCRKGCVEKCRGGGGEGCKSDADCPEGQVCQKGKCVAKSANCGKGKVTTGAYPNGIESPGCACSAAYYPNEGEACREGYHAVGEGTDYRCECDTWGGLDGQEGLGEFNWSTGLQSLLDRLMGRANEFLDRKPGISDMVIRSLFGSNYDKLRQAGTASRNQAISDLQSAGLSGTGVGMGNLGNVAWNTEKGIADTIRQIMFANEAQKKTDLLDYTNAAQGLTNQQMTAQQAVEALNAGRRGEANTALALLMQYLAMMMNSWAA